MTAVVIRLSEQKPCYEGFCIWCCEPFTSKDEKAFCSKPCTWNWMYARDAREQRDGLHEVEALSEESELEVSVVQSEVFDLPQVGETFMDGHGSAPSEAAG
jgi:hypothetical protein